MPSAKMLTLDLKKSELDVIEAALATAASSYDAKKIGVTKIRNLRGMIHATRVQNNF